MSRGASMFLLYMGQNLKIKGQRRSSLHWLILGFPYAFFVQWSILTTQKNNSMETTEGTWNPKGWETLNMLEIFFLRGRRVKKNNDLPPIHTLESWCIPVVLEGVIVLSTLPNREVINKSL